MFSFTAGTIQVDSAARLLQSAMRSFVLRRQKLSEGPPRSTSGGNPANNKNSNSSRPSSGSDRAQAVFAAVDAADGPGRGSGSRTGSRGGSRLGWASSSRKSVAGAVGGGWEASGAHAASTLVDVFPAEDDDGDNGDNEDEDHYYGRAPAGQRQRQRQKQRPGGNGGLGRASSLSRERGVVARSGSQERSGGFGVGSKGVSILVMKFLEGPALERFGGGSRGNTSFRPKSSVGTFVGSRSTGSFAATNSTERKSSGATSVRFVDGGRRSTVGGWGENDEAARPGTSVCKDCLSDVASLLAVAMAPARATVTVMEVREKYTRVWMK